MHAMKFPNHKLYMSIFFRINQNLINIYGKDERKKI